MRTTTPHHVCHTSYAGELYTCADAPEHAAGLPMLRRQPVLGVVVQAAEQLVEARTRAALPQNLRRNRLLCRDNCAPHAAALTGLRIWARHESAGQHVNLLWVQLQACTPSSHAEKPLVHMGWRFPAQTNKKNRNCIQGATQA